MMSGEEKCACGHSRVGHGSGTGCLWCACLCFDAVAIPEPIHEQVGGDHYSKLDIQPAEYIHRNGIGFLAGCAIKYLTRYPDKGGVEDLRKARHIIDMLIGFEE